MEGEGVYSAPVIQKLFIRRSPNPHLTFGSSVHVCLGYPLARLETRIAFSIHQPSEEYAFVYFCRSGKKRVSMYTVLY